MLEVSVVVFLVRPKSEVLTGRGPAGGRVGDRKTLEKKRLMNEP